MQQRLRPLDEASQTEGTLSKAVVPKWLRRACPGNQGKKNALKRLAIEFRMLSGSAIVALEARQNEQLSSHWMASRPLRKRCPLPAVSSFSDPFSAALSAAEDRFGLA